MTPPILWPRVRYKGRRVPVHRDCLGLIHHNRRCGMTQAEAVANALYVYGITEDREAAVAALDAARDRRQARRRDA